VQQRNSATWQHKLFKSKNIFHGFIKHILLMEIPSVIKISQDPDEFLVSLKNSADQGNVVAQYELAKVFLMGQKTKKNIKEGLYW
jgi:hypothetical protein